MAKLTISDAARVAHVSRITLHRYIKAGKLSRTPDGSIDTAELVRAGFVLHLETLPAATPITAVQQPVTPTPVTGPVAAETHASQRLIALLQEQVDHLRVSVHRYEKREDDYRARISWLQQQVEQVQQQNTRLLDAPRPAPPVGAVVRDKKQDRPTQDRGTMRRRILALLEAHPEGLSPAVIRQRLQIDKPLGNTCIAMARDGLLQRVGHGWYTVACRAP